MSIQIENIELDEDNKEFNFAANFVNYTDEIIYLTGKAGTGKTTFLKYLSETSTKNKVILAPTGVAAINAGGQTIHSFFQIKPSIYVPNDKRLRTKAESLDVDKSTIYDHFKYSKESLEIIRGLELLIIDEVSMVRCDLLDVIDRLLKVFRKRENTPFGGVQVILIGDTFQLPPIAVYDQWEILKGYYESPYFFSSQAIKPLLDSKQLKYIELKKIYRQKEQEFVDLLNRIRINQITQNELNTLNAKYDPSFKEDKNGNYITLATHNKIVEQTNLLNLSELQSELKLYEASVKDTFPDNILPTEKILQLKVGAQIMFIRNNKSKDYYNGKIAKIIDLEEKQIKCEFSDGTTIAVLREVWNNVKYSWDEKEGKIKEEIIGTFTQFPIRLAWAITVHKSQGLTFEKVIADLGAAFSPGQVYVALSRCTSFNGLVLKTKIDRGAIKTDPKVLLFAQNELPNTLILKELNSGKADFYYKKSREALKNSEFDLAYDYFLNALKFRNDVETNNFKRYFITFLNRKGSSLEFYKEENKNNLAEIENLNIEFSNTNTNLTQKFDELKKENNQQKQKIIEQNNSVKLLLDKTQEFEKSNETLIKELEVVQKQILESQNEIAKLQNEKIAFKKNVTNLKATIYLKESEINRLNNIKWYQKLLGFN